jgi:flagellar motor switch protein FliM
MTQPAPFTKRSNLQASSVKLLDLTGRERTPHSAMVVMDKVAVNFARSVRRSMPFLVRYRARIAPQKAEVVKVSDLPAEIAGTPIFCTYVATADAMGWGYVALNPHAIAVTLEGALGGRSVATAQLPARELSVAQRALLSRIGRSLATDLSMALRDEVKLSFGPVSNDPSPESKDGKTQQLLRVVCEIEGLEVPAALIVCVSCDAIEGAVRAHELIEGNKTDPRISDAVHELPIEVVAELGRVTLGLSRVMALRPGDVVRLPTATDDPVSVRVAGLEKFSGAPITSLGQLAV